MESALQELKKLFEETKALRRAQRCRLRMSTTSACRWGPVEPRQGDRFASGASRRHAFECPPKPSRSPAAQCSSHRSGHFRVPHGRFLLDPSRPQDSCSLCRRGSRARRVLFSIFTAMCRTPGLPCRPPFGLRLCRLALERPSWASRFSASPLALLRPSPTPSWPCHLAGAQGASCGVCSSSSLLCSMLRPLFDSGGMSCTRADVTMRAARAGCSAVRAFADQHTRDAPRREPWREEFWGLCGPAWGLGLT